MKGQHAQRDGCRSETPVYGESTDSKRYPLDSGKLARDVEGVGEAEKYGNSVARDMAGTPIGEKSCGIFTSMTSCGEAIHSRGHGIIGEDF